MNIQILTGTLEMATEISKLCLVLGDEASASEVATRLGRILSSREHHFVVARLGGEVVGFCHAYIRNLVEVPIAVEIGGLGVSESAQGKGVGTALITEVEKWTKGKGISRIVLHSNVSREAAHEFYKNLGFSVEKQQLHLTKNL